MVVTVNGLCVCILLGSAGEERHKFDGNKELLDHQVTVVAFPNWE